MKNHLLKFYLILLFLSACSEKNAPPLIENAKIKVFLNKFFLQEGAIYTLLGNKPLTDMLIFTGTPEDISLEGVSEESLNKMQLIEDDTLAELNAWKKFSKNLEFKNFCFAERYSLYDPSYVIYFLINLEALNNIFKENQIRFKETIGFDVEFSQIICERNDPDSVIWNRLLQDHYLMGLLHGYGEENSQYFSNRMNEPNPKDLIVFSDRCEEDLSLENFPLPNYAKSQYDTMTNYYQTERDRIRKEHSKQDLMQIVINYLQK